MAKYSAAWRDGYPDPAFDSRLTSEVSFDTEEEAREYGLGHFGDQFVGVNKVEDQDDDEKPF